MVSFIIDHDRHPFPLKIKWNLINFPAVLLHIQIGVGKDRTVQEVAQTGLIVAVHVGVPKNVVVLVVGHVHMLLQNDTILSQCSGLISAKDVDRAQVLDRTQPFNDDLFVRHLHRPLGQIHRDDHREHFRSQSDSDGQRKLERREPIAAPQANDQEHCTDHNHHETHHQPCETGNPPVKTCLNPVPGKFFRNRSVVSL